MTSAEGTKKNIAASTHRLIEEVPLCAAAAIHRGPNTVAMLKSKTDFAILQKNDDIGEFLRQMRVVRHDNRRFAKRLFQSQDQVAHVPRHDWIHHGRRLVVQNRFGILRQRAPNGHGALHTGGKLAGQFVHDVVYFQHMRDFHDVRVDVLIGQSRLAIERKRHILAHSQRIEERAGLKDHRHFASHFLEVRFPEIRHVLPVDEDMARLRFQESHDVFQRN